VPLERSEKPLGENPLSKAEKATSSVAFFAERLGFGPAMPLERSEKPLGENPLSKAEKATSSIAFFAERLGFGPAMPLERSEKRLSGFTRLVKLELIKNKVSPACT